MHRKRWTHMLFAIFAVCSIHWLTLPAHAHVGVIDVNSFDDVVADDGQCTLREAVTAANTNAPSGNQPGECAAGINFDVINLSAGTYTLTIAGSNEDNNATGDLDILEHVDLRRSSEGETIIQAGTDATNGIDRVFDVPNGVTGNVYFNFLTIRHGRTQDGAGFRQAAGGGIYAGGPATVHVVSSVVRENYSGDSGGGIYAVGNTFVVSSEVANNRAYLDGGGIQASTNLTFNNSTLSGNEAGSQLSSTAGGIYANNSESTFEVHLYNSTIANNVDDNSFRGGIFTLGTTIHLHNSILTNNSGVECAATGSGSIVGSNNLVDDASCVASQGAVTNFHGSLQDNGSGRRTHALLPGSNAIDMGNNACRNQFGNPVGGGLDQRYVPRPQGDVCDIGAYEFDGTVPLAVGLISADTLHTSPTLWLLLTLLVLTIMTVRNCIDQRKTQP